MGYTKRFNQKPKMSMQDFLSVCLFVRTNEITGELVTKDELNTYQTILGVYDLPDGMGRVYGCGDIRVRASRNFVKFSSLKEIEEEANLYKRLYNEGGDRHQNYPDRISYLKKTMNKWDSRLKEAKSREYIQVTLCVKRGEQIYTNALKLVNQE